MAGIDLRGSSSSGSAASNGLPSTIVNRTTTYTASAGDFVLADATTAGFTVTLPAAPAAGSLVIVKKTDGTANVVTVAPSGGGTIDGDANATITSPQFGGIFSHTGSNVWKLVAPTSAGGSNGINGNTILTTSGPPSNLVGTNNDYAIDPIAKIMYGPKASGAWPGGTSLQGPAGSNGTNGAISVIQDEGSALTVRANLNFIGSGVTATDDAANSRTNVTIPGGGGSPTQPTLLGIRLKAGEWTAPPITSVLTNGFASSGEVYATRLPVAKGGNINGLAVDVTTAGGTGSTCKLALAADDGTGFYPGVILAVSGALNSAAIATLTFTPGAAQAVADGTTLWLVSGFFGAPSPNPILHCWNISTPANTPLGAALGYTFATTSQFFAGNPNYPLGWRLTGQSDLPAAAASFPTGAAKITVGSGFNVPAIIALGS